MDAEGLTVVISIVALAASITGVVWAGITSSKANTKVDESNRKADEANRIAADALRTAEEANDLAEKSRRDNLDVRLDSAILGFQDAIFEVSVMDYENMTPQALTEKSDEVLRQLTRARLELVYASDSQPFKDVVEVAWLAIGQGLDDVVKDGPNYRADERPSDRTRKHDALRKISNHIYMTLKQYQEDRSVMDDESIEEFKVLQLTVVRGYADERDFKDLVQKINDLME